MSKQDFRPGGPVERFTRMMFTRIIAALARTLRDESLSVAQVAALHLIDQAGALRVSALAEELTLSASATSRLAEGLVQRDLVARDEDPDDRRAKVLTLTAAGRRFIATISEGRLATIAGAAEALPKELVARVLAAMRSLGDR
ncbi:MAG: MarR family transcriptional regulator [Nannocystaceae bacterium]